MTISIFFDVRFIQAAAKPFRRTSGLVSPSCGQKEYCDKFGRDHDPGHVSSLLTVLPATNNPVW